MINIYKQVEQNLSDLESGIIVLLVFILLFGINDTIKEIRSC